MESYLTVLVAVVLVSTAHASMFDFFPGLGPPSMTCTEITPSGNTPIYFRSEGTYPYSYNNDHDACWVIKSGDDGVKPRLRVTFSAIEALYGLVCTAADFIEIRDGNSLNSTLLLRWCGWGHPNFAFEPSGTELFVYFHTDSSISYGGFEMKAYLNETAEVLMSAEDGPVTFPSLGQLPGRGLQQGGSRPNGGSGGPRGRPAITTTPRSQLTFNNNEQSRNQFNNNLRENLASTSSGTKDTGMIVGIVIAVLLGVVLLGVAIHVVTKSCIMKNRPPWNPLENVIIPQRRRPGGFDSLESGGDQGAVGGHPAGGIGQNSGKYALPGPVVSAPPQPHPGLVFANANALGYTPGTGMMNDDFYPDAPMPAMASALPSNSMVSSRNLLTTTSNTPVDLTSAMGDIDNDIVTTPRLGAFTDSSPSPGNLGPVPPRCMHGAPPSFTRGSGGQSGMSPPPLYSSVDGGQPRANINASHVSLPPAYDDVPTH